MNGCILVFGMPRSGSTWIGKLFDSHPDTLYRHEPDSVQRLSLPAFPEMDAAPHYRHELQQFVASLPYFRHSKVVGKQPLFRKSYQSAAGFGAYRAGVAVAKVASRLHRNFPCPCRPTAEGAVRARLIWKSIESQGRLGVCIAALPDARAIHLMRHPCGYVASLWRGQAASRFDHPESRAGDRRLLGLMLATRTGKSHGLSIEELERLTPEERLAWRWVLIQEKTLTDIEGCDRVLAVRYEDVCAEPLATTRRMFEFTGLDFQPQTDSFLRASTGASDGMADTDYYSVYKRPQTAAERWRTELAPDVIERILAVLRNSSLHRWYPDEVRTPAALTEPTT